MTVQVQLDGIAIAGTQVESLMANPFPDAENNLPGLPTSGLVIDTGTPKSLASVDPAARSHTSCCLELEKSTRESKM